jgi:hypothetical protein
VARARALGADARHGNAGLAGGGLLHGAFIALSNSAYHWAARVLTRWENHRTAAHFDGALIIKSCLFVFFNSYSTLFYIAFCKASDLARPRKHSHKLTRSRPTTHDHPLIFCQGRWLFAEDTCEGGDCMAELELEGVFIFGAQIFFVQARRSPPISTRSPNELLRAGAISPRSPPDLGIAHRIRRGSSPTPRSAPASSRASPPRAAAS